MKCLDKDLKQRKRDPKAAINNPRPLTTELAEEQRRAYLKPRPRRRERKQLHEKLAMAGIDESGKGPKPASVHPS
jgi:hypothetical protein